MPAAQMPTPGAPDLAADLGLPEEQVERVAATLKGIGSLEAVPDDGLGIPLAERIADESQQEPPEKLDGALLRSVFESELGCLKPREREVLRLRFGLGDSDELTLQEVGERLGLSRERVRQIQSEALARLGSQRRVRALREMLPPGGARHP